MEIKVRTTCPHCNGSGRAMSDEEAAEAARKHNRAASCCSMSPNYLQASDFSKCSHCGGVGKMEKWVPLAEIMATQA